MVEVVSSTARFRRSGFEYDGVTVEALGVTGIGGRVGSRPSGLLSDDGAAISSPLALFLSSNLRSAFALAFARVSSTACVLPAPIELLPVDSGVKADAELIEAGRGRETGTEERPDAGTLLADSDVDG
jgi:hypothetical protein